MLHLAVHMLVFQHLLHLSSLICILLYKKKVRYVQIVEEDESSEEEGSGKEEEEDERIETVGHVSEPASCYGWTSEDETLLHQTIFGITPLTTSPSGPNQEKEREGEKCEDNKDPSPPSPLADG